MVPLLAGTPREPNWLPCVTSRAICSCPFRGPRFFETTRDEDYTLGGAMKEITDHDAYIAAAPEPLRPLLIQLHEQLARVSRKGLGL